MLVAPGAMPVTIRARVSWSTIASLAGQGRSLREIAAEVGVSHETVRLVLRTVGQASR